MKRLFLFIISLVLLQSRGVAADTNAAVARLAEMGFQNVRVANYDKGVVYACFESTTYRGTFFGAAAALKELSTIYPEIHEFKIMLLDDQTPRVALTANCYGTYWRVEGSYDLSELRTALEVKPKQNSSAGRVDLTFYPMFSWINHRLTRPCEYVLSLAPALQTSLWPGNRIILQPVIPISYNVESINSESYVHIGVANVAQDFTTRSGRLFGTVVGGFFLYDRWGFDVRLGYHVSPLLSLSAEASITGSAVVNEGHYDINALNKFSAFLKADYYHPATHLQGQLQAGRFVFGDYGVRADVSRHFGDYTIGLYGVYTEGEHNAGFHFAIPFGPRHQGGKGKFRLRMPDYFDWEYSMVSYYEYYDQQMGRTVEIRPDENRSAHYWQPAHVAQYTQKVLNGEL